MNQLIIKNLKVFAYHGVHEFEKIKGQPFFIDAIIELPLMDGFKTDNINEVLNYSSAIKVIKYTMQKEKYNLIEKVTYMILKNLFDSFKEIISIDITVKKPNAPIKEYLEYVAFKTIKKRSDM